MDTMISMEIVAPPDEPAARAAIQRALGWFAAVEHACSRFDPQSEVRQLLEHTGTPVPVSSILFEAARFAVALAERTGGAFDPTIGHLLEARGFDRNYLTGEHVRTALPGGPRPTYRDITLDPQRRTLALRRPLVLDLGAVAKGLAIDLAARELASFGSYCVDAGGDLFAAGHNADGRPWQIGVQHPRDPQALSCTLEISGRGVCTSGDYERQTAPSPPDPHSARRERGSGGQPDGTSFTASMRRHPSPLAVEGPGVRAYLPSRLVGKGPGGGGDSRVGEGPGVRAEPVVKTEPGVRAHHHLLNPRTGESVGGLVSVTVVASTTMAADGLATAAFVLGPSRGLRLLRREGVEGVLITPSGDVLTTPGAVPGPHPRAAHQTKNTHP